MTLPRLNLRRLNYILIRGDADSWETWLKGRFGRFLLMLISPFIVLTPEGGVVAVTALLTGAAGVDVHFTRIYLVFCGLFSLLIAAFLARFIFARPGALTLSAWAPARVASGQPVVVTLELTNPNPKPLWVLRVQGPFLAWDGRWLVRRPTVPVLGPGEQVRVESTLVLTERGQRPIGRFSVASVRPLGLVRGKSIYSEPVRIIVVPRTLDIEGLAPPPLIAADNAEHVRGHANGADFELAGLRPYRPGDRIRDLHARSWARLGEPMVRTFRRTAQREAAVILDASAVRFDEAAFEGAVSLTASLVRWACGHGARVRLLILADRSREIVVGAQVAPVDIALDALAAVARVEAPPPDATARAAAVAVSAGTYLIHADWPLQWTPPGTLSQVVVGGERARQAAIEAGVGAFSAKDLAGDRVLLR